MFLGPQALKKVIEGAELYPIRGLFNFREFFPEIDSYYLGIRGDELGIPTGWKCMDELYKVSTSFIFYLFFIFSLRFDLKFELAFSLRASPRALLYLPQSPKNC
jgi:hypothetical protein